MTKKKINKKKITKKNNLKTLSNILKSTKESDKLILNILDFVKNTNNNDFPKLYNNTKFFGSDKLGKSGGRVGILNKNLILKYYQLDENIKYKTNCEKKCIQVYFPFNELIINTIFNNLNLFLSKKKKYHISKKI